MNRETDTGWDGDDVPADGKGKKPKVSTIEEALSVPQESLLRLDVERPEHERPADLVRHEAAERVDAHAGSDEEGGSGVMDESWMSFDGRGVPSPVRRGGFRGRGRGGLSSRHIEQRGPARGPIDEAFTAWMAREGDGYGITVTIRPTGKTDGVFVFGGRVAHFQLAQGSRLEAKDGATWVTVPAYVSKYLRIEEAREFALRSAIPGIQILGSGSMPSNMIRV